METEPIRTAGDTALEDNLNIHGTAGLWVDWDEDCDASGGVLIACDMREELYDPQTERTNKAQHDVHEETMGVVPCDDPEPANCPE